MKSEIEIYHKGRNITEQCEINKSLGFIKLPVFEKDYPDYNIFNLERDPATNEKSVFRLYLNKVFLREINRFSTELNKISECEKDWKHPLSRLKHKPMKKPNALILKLIQRIY